MLRVATAVCWYLAIYLGIATALARWGRAVSNEVKPAHIRVLTFLLFTAGMIFPLLFKPKKYSIAVDFFRGRVSEGYSDTNALQSRNLPSRAQDALYDSRIHVASQKLRVLKHPHQQGHIGLHTLNVEGLQCHRHPAYGLGTGVALCLVSL